jgi:SAM-dependent methyltransferase
MTIRMDDAWSAGATYEDFMGRWSRPLAHEFLAWLDPPPNGHWLDVGTGTGALASAICADADPSSVVGCDPSAPFLEEARSRVTDPRATFTFAESGSLPRREGGYDAVVSGLALNFFPDPEAAVTEQLGLVRSGGLVAAFVWDYAGGMQFLRRFWDAAIEVEPQAASLDEGRRFPICNPKPLAHLFESAGARDVRVGDISVPTTFQDFSDYWRPFLGGTGPAPSLVSGLSSAQRKDLAERLENRLAPESGAPIELEARAWAVVGYRA